MANKKYPDGTCGICMVAVIPMRNTPDEKSEMISQILFGEIYDVNEVLEKWLKITALFDQFTGWIDRKFFNGVDPENESGNPVQTVLYSRLAEIDLPDGTVQLISGGSTLPGFDPANNEFRIGKQKYRIRPMLCDTVMPKPQNLQETARLFMNTPYLWGGRSVFGFDCSGFLQTVFKIHGIALQRETIRQVLYGQEVSILEDTVPGDLAFFCNGKGTVNHVGMILAGSEIIHCSGWVRVDRLDEKGIFNRESGVYTHRLMSIRRMNR